MSFFSKPKKVVLTLLISLTAASNSYAVDRETWCRKTLGDYQKGAEWGKELQIAVAKFCTPKNVMTCRQPWVDLLDEYKQQNTRNAIQFIDTHPMSELDKALMMNAVDYIYLSAFSAFLETKTPTTVANEMYRSCSGLK